MHLKNIRRSNEKFFNLFNLMASGREKDAKFFNRDLGFFNLFLTPAPSHAQSISGRPMTEAGVRRKVVKVLPDALPAARRRRRANHGQIMRIKIT